MNITSLTVSVRSEGIKETSQALGGLSTSAANAAKRIDAFIEATNRLKAASMGAATAVAQHAQQSIQAMNAVSNALGAGNVASESAVSSGRKLSQTLIEQRRQYEMYNVSAREYARAQGEANRVNREMDNAKRNSVLVQQKRDLDMLSISAKQYAATQAEAIKLNREYDKASVSQKLIQQKRDTDALTSSSRQYASVQAEALRMNRDFDKSLASQRLLQQRRDMQSYSDAAREYARAHAEAIRMNQQFDRALQQSNGSMREAHGFARGLAGSMGALWVTYGAFLGMSLGVALGVGMKEAISGFTQVEYQMTFLKALTEDTTTSVKSLSHQMHEVSGVLGISPEAAAKGLRALGQAGLDTRDALATLPVAFKLATVGELALDSAALAMTGVMNAYGLKVRDLEHIGDMMSKAGAMSAASVDSMSVSMKYSAGTAEQYGVSLEKLGTILTLLGKRGITGSSAGVAANNLIAEIYSPSSDKAIRAMAALGVKAYADGVRKEFDVVTAEMKSALAKFDGESQGKLLEDMFGKKGGKGFYAVAKAGQEEFLAIEKELVGATGFTAEVYKKSLQTIEGQMNLTKSAIQNTFAQIGEESAAPIKTLLSTVREIASSGGVKDALVGLSQSIKTFLTTVVPAATAVGGLWLAMRVGPPVIAGVTAALGALSVGSLTTGFVAARTAVMGFFAAIQAGNVAMLAANPIFVGIVGVVTLLAGAYLLLKRNKESVMDMHSQEMKNSEDTIKSLTEENALLDRKISLQRRGISGDGEAAELRKMANQDALTLMKEEAAANQKRIDALSKQGPGRSEGSDSARMTEIDRLTNANKALNKAMEDKGKLFAKEAELDQKRLERLKIYREEQKLLRAGEEYAEQGQETPVVGGQKYGGKDAQEAAKAAKEAFATVMEATDARIMEARRAMTSFEEEQNKLFKAGEIGKLQMIERVGNEQVKQYGKIQQAISEKLSAAQRKGDTSEVARYLGDQKQAQADFEAAKRTNSAATEQAITNYQETNSRLRAAQLEKEGKYQAAAAERFSTEHSAAYKQAEADATHYAEVAKKALAGGDEKGAKAATEKAKGASAVFKQLGETQKAAMADGFDKEAMESFMAGVTNLKDSFKSIQTAYEGQGLAAMWEAASAASATYQSKIDELKQKMVGVTDPKQIAAMNAELTNAAEAQRKSWVGVGETIGKSLESAFGRGGKSMGELFEISARYDRLENKTGTARVKAYADAAGAAKGFFKEGTTGYKVLEGAEKAFRLIELAGMAKSLAATVATAGAKALAWVPAVFASFMGSMGPYGAVAAAAALAAVGISAMGGGSAPTSAEQRQKTQGTGSVLGASDAKSESIAKSIEHLEKNSGLGLYHSSEMVKSLKSIQANIGSLASMVVQTTGINSNMPADADGSMAKLGSAIGSPLKAIPGGEWLGKQYAKLTNAIFGGKTSALDTGFTMKATTVAQAAAGNVNAGQYTDMKKDGGLFSKDKYYTDMKSLGAEANAQFGKIIGSFATVLKDANKELGINSELFASELANFNIDIGKISFKDMSGEEIEKELQAVFSKLGDDMAKWAFAGLTPFQKVGEGMLETISRVTNNLIQVKDVFAALDKQFSLTGVAAVTVSEGLIELAGGIENLTEGTKFYVDNFLTQAERMAPITKSVAQRLAELNIIDIKTIEQYKQKIQTLNLMNAADRELYVNMIDLAPAFKEAADYAQDLIDGTVDLTDAQQKALDKVKDARSALQEAYDTEKSSLQGVIDKTKSFIQTLASYKDSLKLGSDSPLTNMQKYDEAKFQMQSIAEKALAGDQAAKDKFTSMASSFLAASKVVNASGNAYTSDFNYVQNMIDKLTAGAQAEISTAETSLEALNRQVAGLLEINKSVLTVAQAIVNLQTAITAGSGAGLSNTQMGLAPTPTIGFYAPEGKVNNDEFIAAINRNTEAVNAQREEQKAQVGAQVAADIEGTDRIVETLTSKTSVSNPQIKLA
jgi:TP901 family phage tail tape measure protein